MDEELKRCPFCGSEAKFKRYYPPFFGKRRRSIVQCTSCRCNSGEWGRADKAIESWNRRVNDDT